MHRALANKWRENSDPKVTVSRDASVNAQTGVSENLKDVQRESKLVQSNMCESVPGRSGRTALRITPVWVKSCQGGRIELVYALLDTGSTHSFCHCDLVKRLGLQGKKTSLQLSTISEIADIKTVEVSLEVQIRNPNLKCGGWGTP